MVNYKRWRDFFRSLRETVEQNTLGSEYSFGTYHVLDVGNFTVQTPEGQLKFSELEKAVRDKQITDKLKEDFCEIFTKRTFSKQCLSDLKKIEDFCSRQVDAAYRLPLTKFYDLVETVTGLKTGREIEAYLNNFLN